MKITLLGAAGGEVTGSAYLLQTDRANVMVDCGLFQGAQKLENFNRLPTRGALQQLDSVVLTHAHLDHTGRLPLLTRFGYTGPIFATPATIELTDLILRDSAYLQAEDAKRQNRRRVQAGQAPIEPLYTNKQVDQLRPLFKRMRYDSPTVVAPGISVRAVEAGHILGSASLEVTVEESGRKKVAGPFLVLAGAGMCTGGRILNHLQNHLPNPTTLVLMVGYQSRGSLGRALVDGASTVRIAGRVVPVKAKTHIFGGLSGHAGQSDLVEWIGALAPCRPRIVLTHGEDGSRATLCGRIKDRFGLASEMPAYRETIEV